MGHVGRYHKDYLNRLGNLTLLARELNKSNHGFTKKKKKFYEKSNVILTKMLIKYTTWNKIKIIERQKELASNAISVWAVN